AVTATAAAPALCCACPCRHRPRCEQPSKIGALSACTHWFAGRFLPENQASYAPAALIFIVPKLQRPGGASAGQRHHMTPYSPAPSTSPATATPSAQLKPCAGDA